METVYKYPGPALLLLYAAVCAYSDLRSRTISLPLCLIACTSGIAVLAAEHADPHQVLLSLLPGILLLATAFLSRGAIGPGDAIFTLICGLYLELGELLIILIFSWMISAAAALFLLLKEHANKKARARTLPFVTIMFPFLILVILSRLT